MSLIFSILQCVHHLYPWTPEHRVSFHVYRLLYEDAQTVANPPSPNGRIEASSMLFRWPHLPTCGLYLYQTLRHAYISSNNQCLPLHDDPHSNRDPFHLCVIFPSLLSTHAHLVSNSTIASLPPVTNSGEAKLPVTPTFETV